MTAPPDELPPERHGQSDPPQSDAVGPRGALTVLVAGVVVAALYFAREILVPVALALLLSFLLAPVVRWLRRLRMGRAGAVLLTVLIAFVAILGFAAFLGHEMTSLAEKLPQYSSNIEAKIRALPRITGGGTLLAHANALLRELRAELVHTQSQNPLAQNSVAPATGAVIGPTKPLPVVIEAPILGPFDIFRNVIGPLLAPLETAGLVIVFAFLILLEREDLRDRLLRLAGARDLQRTTAATNEAAARVGRYLSRQLAVNACCALPIGLGLAVIGIPNAPLWGVLVLVLRFIPYLGILVAAAFPVALAIAVDPGWSLMLWTILLFVGIETVVSNVAEPLLYGASTGLSSVAIIGAAVFWTWLWGPIGLLLSTPLTVCLVVIGRYMPQLRFLSVLLGNEPGLAPEETFYQRLLAHDCEEAAERAEKFAKQKSLVAFFEEVMVPALAMAQQDSDRGVLSAAQREMIKEQILEIIEDLSDSVNAAGKPRRGKVICIAGRNELDEAAAAFAAHLLRLAGYDASVLGAEAIAAGNPGRADLAGEAVLCLSLVSITAPARARYLARRVRRRAPQARLVLALWGVRREEIEADLAEIAAEQPAAPPQLPSRAARPRFPLGFWGPRREEIEEIVEEPPPVETFVTTFGEFVAALEEAPADISRSASEPAPASDIPALAGKQ
jgi:predicted PurR-regulated permease PerM